MLIETADPAISRYIGKITPLKSKIVSYRILGFDTEDDSKGTPLSFAFHDGEDSFYTTDVEEAIDYVYSLKNHPLRTLIFAHNLEYDINNLLKHRDYDLVKEITPAGGRFIRVALHGTKTIFLNSSCFFSRSLAKMGELVGIPKLDGNPLDKEYNIQDSKIVQVFMSQMQERFNSEGMKLPLTISQGAMVSFRTNYMREDIYSYNSPDCLKAYYGGRVEAFRLGFMRGPVYMVDINSSYPTEMMNSPYPNCAYMEHSSIWTHRFGVGEFTVKVPETCVVPPLPYKSETGRLFFPVGEFRGFWTYNELRFAIERCNVEVLEEHSGVGTNEELPGVFNSFIGDNYEARKDAKTILEREAENIGALFDSEWYKLKMNSAYGKFAQHKPTVKYLTRELSDYEFEKLKGKVTETPVGPFMKYTQTKEDAPPTANYLWGAYITAYARISLLEKMMRVAEHGGELIYCDTDSIMFRGKNALDKIELGKNLGQLDLDSKAPFDAVFVRQAKGYLCLKGDNRIGFDPVKLACKGVPFTHAVDFLLKGEANGFRKPNRIMESLVRVNSPANKKQGEDYLKTLAANYWEEHEKTMRRVYFKRVIHKDGTTRAVKVDEIKQLELDSYSKTFDFGISQLKVNRKKKKKSSFENVKIPKGWFKKTGLPPMDKEREAIMYLSTAYTKGMKVGEVFFTGTVKDTRSTNYGESYAIALEIYRGRPVLGKNILGLFPCKFFHFIVKSKENIGRRVEVRIVAEYITRRDVKLEAVTLPAQDKKPRKEKGQESWLPNYSPSKKR